MPIVRKAKAQRCVESLEEQIKQLKKVMEGTEPNPNLWNFYAISEADYMRDFTEVDQYDLSMTLGAIELAIKELKKAKTLAAEKLHK